MRGSVVLAMIGVSLAILRAADKPAPSTTAPATDYAVSEMHIQTLPPTTYWCGAAGTSLDELNRAAGKNLEAAFQARDKGKVWFIGPVMYIYHITNPTNPLTLDVGIVVPEGAPAPPELTLRKTEPFPCATVLYTGPMSNVRQAWDKLYKSMAEKKLERSGEARQMHLYWEDSESKNNVIQLQVGLKEK